MFKFIKYIIYLLLILLCLFGLNRLGVDVKGGFSTAWTNIASFAKDIASSSHKDNNSIYEDINKQDFVGGLGTTTSATNTMLKGASTNVSKNSIAELTMEGIIKYTNIERKKAGLSPLVPQRKLDDSALKKANDMLDKQYFEHMSPSGKTAVNLVKEQGYAYQVVGENLALGDFGSDKKLVEAWMNSSAHKDNILNAKFTEIGIGIVKGSYKGTVVWLAVQHFGKPLPVCAIVSPDLKIAIDLEKTKLETEEKELQALVQEIESDPAQNKGKEFLDAYNAKVNSYNVRLDALKRQIQTYNTAVVAYNMCLGVKEDAVSNASSVQ